MIDTLQSLARRAGAARRVRLLLLACVMAGATQLAVAARLALVIGNAAYADSPLRNPVNDARAMDAKLRALGFAVTKVENLKQRQIGRTVSGFASAIRPGDEVVVFYAGHGLQVKGVNYLPAVDAEIQSEDDVPLNSLNLNALLDSLDEAKAGVKLLFLDACRNNPYARSFRSAGRGLARVSDAPSGTLMHFATRPGRVAADGSGANGLYTAELLKVIDQPGLPVEQLLKRVAANVERASQGEQEPWTEGSLKGDFYFRAGTPTQVNGGKPEPVVPAGTAADTSPALDLGDLQRQAQQQAEQERQQAALMARMQADHDRVAAFTGTPALQAQAWERFLSAWPDSRAPGAEGQALRRQAEAQRDAARQAASRPVGPKPGDVVKDCAECPELVVIPAGKFVMGSPNEEKHRFDDEGPQHEVRVGSFLAGRYAVTFEEWDACVSAGGCSHKPGDQSWGRGRRPVINVSWNDAQEYVKWLSGKTGKSYRLLSEAEWEYAARAGTTSTYSWGNAVGRGNANCDGCGSQWDYEQTAPVGSFKPNAFGLYDMHGNVRQWVQDVNHDSYAGAPADGSAWMAGGEQWARVLRGGSWGISPQKLRSAYRYGYTLVNRNVDFGFRIARTF